MTYSRTAVLGTLFFLGLSNTSLAEKGAIDWDIDIQADLIIACPWDITVSCADDVPAPDVASVNVQDSCGPVTVVHIGDVSNGHGCPEQITRTYQATDSCGNVSTCEQFILIDDQAPPVIICPPDVTVSCLSDVPAPDINQVVASDSCGAISVAHIGDVSNGSACPETITRTYRATDICGNSSDCRQDFIVIDTVPPVIASVPSDITVQCFADVPAMTSLVWTDNCDGAGSISGTEASDHLTCPELITRTWTYTDACGNTSMAAQTITIHDLVGPVVFCPDLHYVCPMDIEAPYTSAIQLIADGGAISDNCGGALQIALVAEDSLVYESEEGSCPGHMVRRYEIMDNCGNAVKCTQHLFVDDSCDPTSVCPPCSEVMVAITESICTGASTDINGVIYDTAGSYVDTIFGGASNGCDSILNITIIGLSDTTVLITKSICLGDTVDINGEIYDTLTTYIDTIFGGAANGCDSILHFANVRIHTHVGVKDSICEGTSVEINGENYDTTGIYTDTLFSTTDAGCDLIYHINISSFADLPPTITYTPIITPDPGYGGGSVVLDSITMGGFEPYTFLWSNGDRGPVADNLLSGYHDVTVTNAIGCDTVLVFHVPLKLPIPPDMPPDRIPVYPNPFGSNIQFDFPTMAFDMARLIIYDVYGHEVLNEEITGAGPQAFSVQGPSGIYFAYIIENSRVLGVRRLLKVVD